MTAGGTGLVQVGIERGHPALGRLSARLACNERSSARASAPIGVVAVRTCHRLELYFENETAPAAVEKFRLWSGGDEDVPPPTVREGLDAARHLLRVAAGLESAVLGEDQILTQLRAAYREACAAATAGPVLHRLFHAAFAAGRRVRAETALGAGTRSLAGAAVAALHQRAGGLGGRSAAVFGSGEMASAAARLLEGRGVARLLIASRTPAHAAALAASVGGEAVRWEWREGLLGVTDVVICAVRSERPILDRAALHAAAVGRATPLIIADLGMPPNVGPATVSGVDLIDLDALGLLQREDAERRASAVEAAEAIVGEELRTWADWTRARIARRQVARVAAG